MQSRRRLNLSVTLKSSQQKEDLEVDIGNVHDVCLPTFLSLDVNVHDVCLFDTP